MPRGGSSWSKDPEQKHGPCLGAARMLGAPGQWGRLGRRCQEDMWGCLVASTQTALHPEWDGPFVSFSSPLVVLWALLWCPLSFLRGEQGPREDSPFFHLSLNLEKFVTRSRSREVSILVILSQFCLVNSCLWKIVFVSVAQGWGHSLLPSWVVFPSLFWL